MHDNNDSNIHAHCLESERCLVVLVLFVIAAVTLHHSHKKVCESIILCCIVQGQCQVQLELTNETSYEGGSCLQIQALVGAGLTNGSSVVCQLCRLYEVHLPLPARGLDICYVAAECDDAMQIGLVLWLKQDRLLYPDPVAVQPGNRDSQNDPSRHSFLDHPVLLLPSSCDGKKQHAGMDVQPFGMPQHCSVLACTSNGGAFVVFLNPANNASQIPAAISAVTQAPTFEGSQSPANPLSPSVAVAQRGPFVWTRHHVRLLQHQVQGRVVTGVGIAVLLNQRRNAAAACAATAATAAGGAITEPQTGTKYTAYLGEL